MVNTGETALLAATRYDAFGQTAAAYDSGASFPTPWRFQGRLDVSPDANPLYDFSARYYDPGTGAFTQLDTHAGAAGDPLSLNRFAYAEANPWSLIDPSGHVALACGSEGCGGGSLPRPGIPQALPPAPTPTPTSEPVRVCGRFGCAPTVSQPTSGDDVDWWETATHFVQSAGTAVIVGLGVATFCVGTVGVGCLVVGGAALGYGAYTSYQRWSDPNVSAQDKLNLAADWAGGIAGGAGLLRAGVGGTATAARTPAQESRAIIQRAADEVTARGPGWLEQWLSAGQLKAIAKNPGLRPAYLGYRYHQAVAKAIPENLRGRITYSYRGVDFTDSLLQTRIELTTVGDLAAHQLQYGVPTPILDYVTYTLPGG